MVSLFSGIAGLELGLSKSNSQFLTMSFIIQGKSSGFFYQGSMCVPVVPFSGTLEGLSRTTLN